MKRPGLASSLPYNRVFLLNTLICGLLFSFACSSKPPQQSRSAPAAQPSTTAPGSSAQATVPLSAAEAEEDGQWTMPAKNYASTRYSGLAEINTENVKNLKVTWTFSTGVNRGQEAAPLVVGNTMYVVTPYPNILYALDLTKPGEAKWKYEPKPAASAQGVACCDLVNRGAVFSNGKIFYATRKV